MTKTSHYLEGVYLCDTIRGERPATRNLVPGTSVYGEELVFIEEAGGECRVWDPYKSKLAAAIMKGMTQLPQMENKRILYLGAAQGTTCSHVSDITGVNGFLACVEFAQKPVQKLLHLVKKRDNMVPVLEDARFPVRIAPFIASRVDVVFQDVSQKEQASIFGNNADFFLKKGGTAILSLKARSIDAKKPSEELELAAVSQLERNGLELLESSSIHEYEKHHRILVFTKP